MSQMLYCQNWLSHKFQWSSFDSDVVHVFGAHPH